MRMLAAWRKNSASYHQAAILDSFRKILVVAGFAIDTLESGWEALGLVQKNKYGFVLTDLKMPEMDGLDVVKGLEHFSPETDVIVITGYATIESAVDAMEYGAMDVVCFYGIRAGLCELLTIFVGRFLGASRADAVR